MIYCLGEIEDFNSGPASVRALLLVFMIVCRNYVCMDTRNKSKAESARGNCSVVMVRAAHILA